VKPWVQTYTGRRFDLASPRAEDVVLEDIAHALSCVNRYTGHARVPYSVAEHSVRVAALVAPTHRKAAILHDATEAYVNDLSAPLKGLPELRGYGDVEHRVWFAICDRFGLDRALPVEVKRADLVMLEVERRVLLGPEPEPWELGLTPGELSIAEDIEAEDSGALGWPWERAKHALRAAFEIEGLR